MSATSDVSTLVALLRLARQGAYTNDPSDANYHRHWNAQPLLAGEHVVEVVPAVAQRATGVVHPRQPVNLRVTDQHNVYVDVPKITSVGPIAGAASMVRRHNGMTEPLLISNTDVTPGVDLHVAGSSVDWTIHPRPDAQVGHITDLSPLAQVREAWRFARGK